MRWTRVVGTLTVVGLLVAACGGGDGSGSAASGDDELPALVGEPISSERLVDIEGVGPLVDLLGEVVDIDAQAVSVRLDSRGGRLELGDGSSVLVARDAFSDATDLDVTVVDVPLDEFATSPPVLTLYVLSTEADVEPSSPVVLEVPVPSSDLEVVAFDDGEWRPVEVDQGSTTSIEFDHFSDQVRATLRPNPDTEATSDIEIDAARLRAYEEAADSFAVCVSVFGVWADSFESRTGTYEDDRSTAALAHAFLDTGLRGCTVALIRKLTPEGEVVAVKCVGDEVDRGASVLEAIDMCVMTDDEWVEVAAGQVADAMAARSDPPAPSRDVIDFETEIVRACLLEGLEAGWSRERAELECGVRNRLFSGVGTMAVIKQGLECPVDDMDFELFLGVDGVILLRILDPIPQVQRVEGTNDLECGTATPQTYQGEWSRDLLGGPPKVLIGSSDQHLEITVEDEFAAVSEEVDLGSQYTRFEFSLIDTAYADLLDGDS